MWEPSPTTWPPQRGNESARGSADASGLKIAEEGQHRAVAAVAGTFAVDGLDGPLSAWLHKVTGLGDRITLRWVSGPSAYSNLATFYTAMVTFCTMFIRKHMLLQLAQSSLVGVFRDSSH